MKISEHRPLLWYLGVVAVSVIVLIYTGFAFTIPFTVTVAIGFPSAIFAYYLYLKKKPKAGEIRDEKTDRLVKEMEKLVAPMHSKLDDPVVFARDFPNVIDAPLATDKYNRFWDEVNQNKYLGPSYLRSAIDNYQKSKSHSVGERARDTFYEKAKAELFDAIKKRYSELEQLV